MDETRQLLVRNAQLETELRLVKEQISQAHNANHYLLTRLANSDINHPSQAQSRLEVQHERVLEENVQLKALLRSGQRRRLPASRTLKYLRDRLDASPHTPKSLADLSEADYEDMIKFGKEESSQLGTKPAAVPGDQDEILTSPIFSTPVQQSEEPEELEDPEANISSLSLDDAPRRAPVPEQPVYPAPKARFTSRAGTDMSHTEHHRMLDSAEFLKDMSPEDRVAKWKNLGRQYAPRNAPSEYDRPVKEYEAYFLMVVLPIHNENQAQKYGDRKNSVQDEVNGGEDSGVAAGGEVAKDTPATTTTNTPSAFPNKAPEEKSMRKNAEPATNHEDSAPASITPDSSETTDKTRASTDPPLGGGLIEPPETVLEHQEPAHVQTSTRNAADHLELPEVDVSSATSVEEKDAVSNTGSQSSVNRRDSVLHSSFESTVTNLTSPTDLATTITKPDDALEAATEIVLPSNNGSEDYLEAAEGLEHSRHAVTPKVFNDEVVDYSKILISNMPEVVASEENDATTTEPTGDKAEQEQQQAPQVLPQDSSNGDNEHETEEPKAEAEIAPNVGHVDTGSPEPSNATMEEAFEARFAKVAQNTQTDDSPARSDSREVQTNNTQAPVDTHDDQTSSVSQFRSSGNAGFRGRHRFSPRGRGDRPQAFNAFFPVQVKDLFKYPAPGNPHMQRTVLIGNVPVTMTLAQVLEAVHGGKVFAAKLVGTPEIKTNPPLKGNTVMVTFANGYSAKRFVEDCSQNPLFLCTGIPEPVFKATVQFVDTPTRPLTGRMITNITEDDISRVIFFYCSKEAPTIPEVLGQLHEEMKVFPLKEPIQCAYDANNILMLEFSNVADAKAVHDFVDRSRYYKDRLGVQSGYLPDPCNRQLVKSEGVDREGKGGEDDVEAVKVTGEGMEVDGEVVEVEGEGVKEIDVENGESGVEEDLIKMDHQEGEEITET